MMLTESGLWCTWNNLGVRTIMNINTLELLIILGGNVSNQGKDRKQNSLHNWNYSETSL